MKLKYLKLVKDKKKENIDHNEETETVCYKSNQELDNDLEKMRKNSTERQSKCSVVEYKNGRSIIRVKSPKTNKFSKSPTKDSTSNHLPNSWQKENIGETENCTNISNVNISSYQSNSSTDIPSIVADGSSVVDSSSFVLKSSEMHLSPIEIGNKSYDSVSLRGDTLSVLSPCHFPNRPSRDFSLSSEDITTCKTYLSSNTSLNTDSFNKPDCPQTQEYNLLGISNEGSHEGSLNLINPDTSSDCETTLMLASSHSSPASTQKTNSSESERR